MTTLRAPREVALQCVAGHCYYQLSLSLTKKFQLLQSAYTTVLEFLESRDMVNGEEEEDAVESSSEESESWSNSSSDLTEEEYLAKKYPKIQDNLKISDTKKSSMSDQINFIIYMAQTFYNIQNRHLLEAIFLALHPIEELFIAYADIFWMQNQVTVYRELLLLGDLPSITQEDRMVDWLLQVARITYPALPRKGDLE